ncbi:hypothetical protein V1515DRAFT_609601, partial [Lipomyces mesembrius]
MLGIGCASHQFNLTIKDILSIDTLKRILDEAVATAEWFRNHHSPLKSSCFSTPMRLFKGSGEMSSIFRRHVLKRSQGGL